MERENQTALAGQEDEERMLFHEEEGEEVVWTRWKRRQGGKVSLKDSRLPH